MSNQTIEMGEDLYRYLLTHSVREPLILTELRAETAEMPGAQMQISPDQGQFMQLLVELMGARRAIDIGTFTGYSALAVAMAMPTNGLVIACDTDERATAVAKSYWQRAQVADKINLKLQPALTTLKELLQTGHAETFDLIFIDADKANYVHYYEHALQLLRHNGLILIDNVLWSGKVADQTIDDKQTNAIRQCNAHVFADERVTISMLAIGDGLMLARKR